ncbi:glycosyltransferase family 1 protein [Cloacibacterium normanense]|nr:glycosyltransferase family 4 protein [Cloacibacterium normanense]AZI69903.1 glycosyltransferase family 1 protein [Cloacibacterium normanense]SDO56764.1 Glycosyltransferase involved in cell wall bisynthesis [Cloacibacterium normanense]
MNSPKPKLFRIATVPMSLNLLLKGQLEFLNKHFQVTAISGEGDDLQTVANREGVNIHTIEMHRPISLRQDLKSLWNLYWYFKKEKPAIIHSITPKAGLLSMMAGKLAGVPVRMHTFTGLIFPHKYGYMKRTLIIMDKILCRCATHVYPEGRGVKEDLQKHNITNKPLKIIANGNVNGVDVDYYHPEAFSEENKKQLRASLRIKEEDFVFVFVGRLVIDKGVRELVKAFDALSKQHQNIKLILVGPRENAHNPKKRAMFHTINQNQKIITVGFQDDVRPYYAVSNVLMLPSYREGFPNAVLQAGAMGLPSIVSDIPGCNEIIEHEVNGLLVPKKNHQELQKAMEKVFKNPYFLLNLKKNARNKVVESFDKNFVWQELKKEYENALDKLKLQKK